MVLKAGFEPARLAAGDFKSPVSAIPPFQPVQNIIHRDRRIVKRRTGGKWNGIMQRDQPPQSSEGDLGETAYLAAEAEAFGRTE